MSDLLRDEGVIKYQAIHQNSSPPWHLLLNQLDEVRTGTPQMALSMAALVNAKTPSSGLIVMAGHEEGIVAYGETIPCTFDQIKDILTN